MVHLEIAGMTTEWAGTWMMLYTGGTIAALRSRHQPIELLGCGGVLLGVIVVSSVISKLYYQGFNSEIYGKKFKYTGKLNEPNP